MDSRKKPAPAILPSRDICLFVDVDGTLIEFADSPAEVRVSAGLIDTLQRLHASLDGALALVSGRSIVDLDRLLYPLKLPTAGLHGMERRDAAGKIWRAHVPSAALANGRTELSALAASHPGLLLEDKHASLALHYRRVPHLMGLARAAVARVAAPLVPEFELLDGDMVVEIKPANLNKATAVDAFMVERPFVGRIPVFVGDDITDYRGFGAVRRYEGRTVAVGDRVEAQWYLPDPAAARAWLAAIAMAGVVDSSSRSTDSGREPRELDLV